MLLLKVPEAPGAVHLRSREVGPVLVGDADALDLATGLPRDGQGVAVTIQFTRKRDPFGFCALGAGQALTEDQPRRVHLAKGFAGSVDLGNIDAGKVWRRGQVVGTNSVFRVQPVTLIEAGANLVASRPVPAHVDAFAAAVQLQADGVVVDVLRVHVFDDDAGRFAQAHLDEPVRDVCGPDFRGGAFLVPPTEGDVQHVLAGSGKLAELAELGSQQPGVVAAHEVLVDDARGRSADALPDTEGVVQASSDALAVVDRGYRTHGRTSAFRARTCSRSCSSSAAGLTTLPPAAMRDRL